MHGLLPARVRQRPHLDSVSRAASCPLNSSQGFKPLLKPCLFPRHNLACIEWPSSRTHCVLSTERFPPCLICLRRSPCQIREDLETSAVPGVSRVQLSQNSTYKLLEI